VASLPIRVISRFIPRESPRIATTLWFPSSLPSPSYHLLLPRPTHQLEKLSSDGATALPHIFLTWHSNFVDLIRRSFVDSPTLDYPQLGLSKRPGRARHSTRWKCVAAYIKKCSDFRVAMQSNFNEYEYSAVSQCIGGIRSRKW